MRKLWFAVGMLIVSSSVVQAQGRVLKVSVDPGDNPDKLTQQVSDGIKAKVGSTLRYALTTKESSLLIVVNCLSTPNTNACHIEVTYWPDGYVALSESLRGTLVMGPPSYMIDTLFNDFVETTTDEELKKNTEIIEASVSILKNKSYTEGYEDGRKHCVQTKKQTQ